MIAAASKKLQEELSDKLTGSVSEDGGLTQEEKPAPNGVAGVSKTEEKKEKVEEEGGEKKEWRQSLQEDQMIQTLNTSPKARRHLSSESLSSNFSSPPLFIFSPPSLQVMSQKVEVKIQHGNALFLLARRRRKMCLNS